MNRLRLEFAAEAFLTSMRRSALARGDMPNIETRQLSEYPPGDRSVLMKAVGHAIKAASEQSDKDFESWIERRQADVSQEA